MSSTTAIRTFCIDPGLRVQTKALFSGKARLIELDLEHFKEMDNHMYGHFLFRTNRVTH